MFTPEEIKFIIDSLSFTSDKAAMIMNSFDNPVTNQALALIEKLKNL